MTLRKPPSPRVHAAQPDSGNTSVGTDADARKAATPQPASRAKTRKAVQASEDKARVKAGSKKTRPPASTPASDKADAKVTRTSQSRVIAPSGLNYVGIGASAGGLEALRPFVANLPTQANMTYIIAQHMSPDHRSLMVELLARETRLPVEEARNNQQPKANTIYVAPPNADITVAKGKLRISKPAKSIGPKPSVDRFFMSLAEDREDCAIGIILSGTGSDGARGIKAIKAAGGISIAQEPKSAKYDSMPNAAIRAGGSDLVLPSHEIAEQLSAISQRPRAPQILDDAGEALPSSIQGIVRQIASHVGIDFSSYKDATISRQIMRRMAAMQIPTLDAYSEYIRSHRQELSELAGNFLICVTAFFRDTDSFKALRTSLQDLLDSKRPGDEIRIWIPGCATGEEVYTVAILLSEALGVELSKYRIQLFATDINVEAVDIARAGVYPESALSGIDSALVTRYFHAHDGMYHVEKRLRDMTLFARHDLVQDPPFVRLDMITCRNLLIYFKSELQERVMKVFHYALRDNGLLFLGKSESIGRLGNLYAEKDRHHKIFTKRPVRSPVISGFPRISTAIGNEPVLAAPEPVVAPESLAHERLAQLYTPASMLMTVTGDILELFGDCSAFLAIKGGKADFNAFNLINPPFRAELRAYAQRVARTRQSATGTAIALSVDGQQKSFQLAVHSLEQDNTGATEMLLVCFQPVQGIPADNSQTPAPGSDQARISVLEDEALHHHENLQTVVEELETANEELQSMHEEAQAANEELQASNEELETANEELQASNEELITVNDELSTRTQQLSESSNDLLNVLDSLYQGVLVVDGSLTITRYNAIATEFFDIPPGSRPNLSTVEMKVTIPDMLSHVAAVLKHGKVGEVEFRRGDGSFFILRLTPYLNENSDVVSGVVLSIIDITTRRAAEEKMRLSASVFEHAIEGTMIADADGQIISVNPAFSRITGYAAENVIGQPAEMLRPAGLKHEVQDDLWHILQTKGVWQGELSSTRKNGERYTVWLSINALKDKSGKVVRYISVFSDITHTKLAQETIHRQATRDALTGLPNRAQTLDRLSQMLSTYRRNMAMFAVLFMDLDHFKLINDSLGHAAGDELLVTTAQRIKGALRDSDSVGRMGGDEFIVLLGNLSSAEDIIPIADSILAAVRQPLVVAGHTLQTGASIGITVYPMDGATPETLLKNADNAMYEAKKNGRNTFCFFTHHMQDEANKRHWIDRELGTAVTTEHLKLYYQPIIQLDTMALAGAEALLRWRHPVRGFIPPESFVPVAEQSGMIGKLSQWVVNTGLKDWADWTRENGAKLSLSFNLSAAQFVVRDHIEMIVGLLENSELARENRVLIEITESLKLSDNVEYVEILNRLRQCGCKIAIDDFGSGYSSLSYLKRMPIDIIKIDKAFVRDITTDATDAAVVRAILQMAEAFGMKTVAEGVGTPEQLAFLQAHGCTYAQGYLFSQPMPYGEFSTYARNLAAEALTGYKDGGQDKQAAM